jgi:hypothetical protein
MKQLVKHGLFVTALVSLSAIAADTDVAKLSEKVDNQVTAIEATGFLPTATEIEVIAGDIVNKEIQTTDLTVEQAVEKYQLTPTLQRYITIKKAQADIAAKPGNGGGLEPPAP